MQQFHVSADILHACSQLQLGCLQCSVANSAKNEFLWKEIANQIIEIQQRISIDQINKIPAIQKTREVYKILGKDPSRYRPSAEALSRRIIQGKGLYQVNSVVDTINFLSLESGYSIGAYDSDKISGTITLKKGSKIDEYLAIGRGKLNIGNLPVLFDNTGPIGSPTSDSERTSISLATKQILLVFFDFSNNELLYQWTERAAQLLIKYSNAVHLEQHILKFTQDS